MLPPLGNTNSLIRGDSWVLYPVHISWDEVEGKGKGKEEEGKRQDKKLRNNVQGWLAELGERLVNIWAEHSRDELSRVKQSEKVPYLIFLLAFIACRSCYDVKYFQKIMKQVNGTNQSVVDKSITEWTIKLSIETQKLERLDHCRWCIGNHFNTIHVKALKSFPWKCFDVCLIKSFAMNVEMPRA